MFLFRKKKENPEVKEEAKPEVKKAAPPVKVVDKAARAAAEKSQAAPVKVAPAPVAAPKARVNSAQPQSPEEIADSLLVKVDQDPDIENVVDDAVVEAVLKPVLTAAAPAPVIELPAAQSNPATGTSTEKTETTQADAPVEAALAPPEKTTPVVTPPFVPAAPPVAAAPAVVTASPVTPAPKEGGTKPEAPKAEFKPEEKKSDGGKKEDEDKGNLFSSLFGKADVEEETSLDRLIKSLPDVSIEEVVNEADEVKNLMNEWYQNPARQ